MNGCITLLYTIFGSLRIFARDLSFITREGQVDAPNRCNMTAVNGKLLAGQAAIHGALKRLIALGLQRGYLKEEQHLISLGTEFTNIGLRF